MEPLKFVVRYLVEHAAYRASNDYYQVKNVRLHSWFGATSLSFSEAEAFLLKKAKECPDVRSIIEPVP
jgi:hypothetical protein